MAKFDKKNIEDILPLTPMQEGMLFHYLKDPGSDIYFEQLSLEIAGEIDFELFEQAWNYVVQTNEMLRAVFRWEKIEHPIQIILKKHQLQPKFYDLSGKERSDKKTRVENIKNEDRKEKFDLREVPFRVILCKVEENKFEMIISNHHILYDGWSNGIILKEFFKAYHKLYTGNPLIKPHTKPSIKEFIKGIQKNNIQRQEEFWKYYLKDYGTGSGIPVKAQRRKTKKIKQTSCYRFKFPGEICHQIKAFVKIHKLTLYSLLCSAWGLLLQKYNSTEDIVYDTTVSGRSAKLKGMENIVGLFINTLPMRVNTAAHEKITGFLSRMYASLQKREEFENSSLVNIKEYLETNTPDTLFDSVVIIENYPLDKQMMQGNKNKSGKLSFNWFSIFERTNYDLTVVITAFDDIDARITYNTDIFDEDLVFRICRHFVDIVKIFIGNPSADVSDINMPVKEERARILNRLKKSQRTGSGDAADQYTAPRDGIEARLAKLWSSVLKIEKSSIGIGANFFDFGGHSLKASVLASKIHKEFNVKMPLAQVFKRSTLEKMAAYIKSKIGKIRGDRYLSIESVENREYYDLSPAQKRFYILQQMHPERVLFNMPAVITFEGDIDKEMLDKTFQQLIKRHESLRTSFIMIDGKPVQRVHDDVEFDVQYYDAPQFEAEKIHNFIRPFNLSKAPLMRVRIISTPGRKNILVIDIHHIVSDGASQQVLARDFTTLIPGEELPPLRLQYKDSCRWQEHSFRTGRMKEHEEYWLNRLGGILPKLKLPTDYPRPSLPAYTGNTIRITLPGELTRDLYALIRRTGTTLYIILLAAFNILLNKYTGHTDIIIGSPTARRDHADMENVIGLVMGGIMMRNSLHEERTILEFIEEVKESTLEAYEHQEYPSEELVKKLGYQEDGTANFISPVRLNVQNMFDPRSLGKYRLQSLEQFSYVPDTSKLDITITAIEWGEWGDAERKFITLEFEYSTELFKHETIEKLSGRFQQLLKEIVENPHMPLWEIDMIPPGEKQVLIGSALRCLPLSHAQKRIYYTEKTYPGTGCNTLAFSVRYGEILDKELLEAAIHSVILRHEGLRLRILEFESTFEPYQYIAPYEKEPLDSIEFTGTNQGEDILELLDRKTLEPFTFFNSRLFYFAYIRFNRQESGYYIKLHHIISDGWALKLLIEEIDTIYSQLKDGEPGDHAAKSPYIQYIRDEKTYLHSRQAQEDREFWHRTLLPLPEADLLLFKDRNLMDILGGIELLTIPSGLRNRMHHCCKEQNTTLFKLIFAGLSIYIARATGNGDIAVGSAGHNRSTTMHKQTVGMFASTIPFRAHVEEELSFADFIKKIDLDINHIIRNRQKYPFDLLMDEIRETNRQDLHKLLDVNLVGHGDIRAERFKIHLHFKGYESSPISIHINYSNLEIHGILQLEWYYQRAMFSPGDIRDMHKSIVNILSDALEYPGKKIDQVEWIMDQEKQRILFRFNDTEKTYPLDKTFPERFREQVEKNPDSVALVGKEEGWKGRRVEGKKEEEPFGPILNAFARNISITYRELNEKSDRLAGVLRSKGVEPNTIVGIMTQPSVEMIIGLLGILKAGGAYLPIEPEYPGDRIEYMIKESGTKILLTGNSLYPFDIPGSSLPCVLVSHPSDLAYVIYTSGSTGRPKGVLVEHGNLMAYLMAFENQFTLTPDDTVIQQYSFVFDAFVEELYPILLKGGVLAIPEKDGVKDIARLVKFMVRHHVTVITTSPLLLNELNKAVAAGVTGLCIRIYISGGDVLNARYIDELLQTGEVYNTYGPTESTVCAAYYKCEEEVPFNVPIGKPIANYNVYILDKKKRLLPVGIGGELCVSGPGVTRGYLNNPGLTAEKFKRAVINHSSFVISSSLKTNNRPSKLSLNDQCPMTNNSSPHYPITPLPHHLIYMTGDLSRWLEDGNIQFLGRIDTQVKIRGYRIEPGEIENRLLTHEDINEAVVIPREHPSADKYLCAYIVLKNPGSINISALKEHLAVELLDYMIPPFFVELERIPLTPNGKLNRKLLPEPDMVALTAYYAAPRDPVEKKLADLWQEILEVDRIGIDDHFFQLGGHSLKAIILISRMNKAFRINVPLAEIFRTPTIRGLSAYIKSKEEGLFTPIEPIEERDYHVLSPAQKRLYILHQMDETSTSYNMPNALRLEGELNKNKLEEIFLRLITRHESLRTSFRMLDGEAVQRIHEDVEFHLDLHDLQDYHDFLRSFIRPFDLSQAPLLRVGLIKLLHTPTALRGHPSPAASTTHQREKLGSKYILLVDMHHIVSDGISHRLLVKEFMALAASKDLPRLRLQYKDFSEWQNSEAQRKALIKQKAYWKTHLEGEIPVLHLPTDYVRPTIQRFEGSCFTFEIDHEEMKKLQSLALAEGITLYMILLSIYYILLSKLSNQEDILVGTPTVGRRHADLQQIIGMFVNTLVLRNYPTGDKTYRGFLKEIKTRSLQAFENQDYPYEALVEELSITRDASRNPLFDTMFVMQNIGIPGIEIPGLKLTPEEHRVETSKFDLTLMGMEIEERLLLTFEYSTNLFKKATIERFRTYFKKIISTVVTHPDKKIGEISVISEEQRNHILFELNDTAVDYPADKTLHQLFEEQVVKTPGNIALHGCMITWMQGEDVSITYKELNEESNQLAHILKVSGVEPDTIVGIMAERSIEMIIALLGILKAGGAYLPIDPGSPGERLRFMLKDSQAKILLTTKNIAKATEFDKEVIYLDSSLPPMHSSTLSSTHQHLPSAQASAVSSATSTCQVGSATMAYIIYTSGSTGEPKGVFITHSNFSPLLHWGYRQLGFSPTDRVVQNLSYYFDWSVWEIFITLTSGPSLYMVSDEIRLHPGDYIDFILSNKITVLHVTPTQYRYLVNCKKIPKTLRYLFIGAETLSLDLVRRSFESVHNQCRVFNMYGPTECTIISAVLEINRADYLEFKSLASVPIGKPSSSTQLFILDKYLTLIPVNITGELYIGGDGVAPGYLNNLELTADKFLDKTLSSLLLAPGRTGKAKNSLSGQNQPRAFGETRRAGSQTLKARIYKTGDLARWLVDGNIEFLGRIDHQVKIKGYRIELGEIENRLLEHKEIREAVVLTGEDEKEDRYLCAYIVPAMTASRGAIDVTGIRNDLLKFLPGYMIPTYFVEVDDIPLTPTGKIDRRALPPVEIGTGEKYIAPRDAVESRLADIWAQVLLLSVPIGIDDHFFQLGGHSLKAINLLSKIHQVFQVKLPLAELFNRPTVRRLSQYIWKAVEERYMSIEATEKKECYALSSAQKRLYFLQQMEESEIAYNIPFILILAGDADKARISGTFKKLIQRHDSLRTSFIMVKEESVQLIHDEVEFEIEYYDLQVTGALIHGDSCRWSSILEGTRGLASLSIPAAHNPQLATALISSFIRPFDLSRAPLFRVGLTRVEEEKHLLMVDMHHIISDGMSTGLLIQDFMALYPAEELPVMRLQYKDFSEWQNSEAQRKALIKQKAYWKTHLEGEIPVLHLPTDYVRPTIQRFEGSSLTFEIDREEMKKLQSLALAEGITLYMILLSIYYILLSKLSNQEDILVGTPTVGRRHADLQQIIGMFVNTLVLRNYPTGDKTYRGFLKEIKTRSLQAFENQDYPYEELVEELSITRDASRNPLFDTMFVLQNTGLHTLEIPGLKVIPYKYETQTSKFDLTLTGVEAGKKLLFTFEYSIKLFKQETIHRFIAYFKNILKGVINKTEGRISQLEIIPEEEKNRILYGLNNTEAEYPKEKTIHELFAEQVTRTPDSIAITGMSPGAGERHHSMPPAGPPGINESSTQGVRTQFIMPVTHIGNIHLTYHELNKKSNLQAHNLCQQGVKENNLVGIMVERSVEMIIGILGILKSGGAYVPLNPNAPPARNDYILDECGVSLLLTNSWLSDCRGESLYSPPGVQPAPRTPHSAANLAYVIFTSGSTGIPKGVPISHANLSPLLHWGYKHLGLSSKDRTIQNLAYYFDWSVWEIFITLTSGACLYPVSEEVLLNPQACIGFINKHTVTVLHVTPTQYQYLINAPVLQGGRKLEKLKYLFIGAEKLTYDLVHRSFESVNNNCRVFNMYGPTEATIISAVLEIHRSDYETFNRLSSIPIGKPVANTSLLILDKYLKLCPVNIVGELYIGGEGLSRGYLNNPGLTDDKFKRAVNGHLSLVISSSQKTPNDQCPMTNDRFYKTGDLSRWLPDGNIEFLGRIDHQVKIRGFRIELEEIENHLLNHHQIKEAVVLAKEDDKKEKYLCAYIESESELMASGLREYLSNSLPGYMIPSYFVMLERIPLTPNGKIDMKALPEPELTSREKEYSAPRNQVEEKLAEIWADVLLGRNALHVSPVRIGIDDDFFQLGGHSLTATIMVAKIHKEFEVQLKLAEIFKTPTIKGISAVIAAAEPVTFRDLESIEKREYYELSYNQKRLWLLSQLQPRGSSYNMAGRIELQHRVNQDLLKKALYRIVHRHESLRTGFKKVNDEPVQYVVKEVKIPFEHLDISLLEENQKQDKRKQIYTREQKRPFDLNEIPLLRILILKLSQVHYDFIFNMHHIITDGWSIELLKKEFLLCYETLRSNKVYESERLKLQYKDFTAWHNKQLADPLPKEQAMRYWKDKLKNGVPAFQLPVNSRGKPRDTRGAAYQWMMDKDTKNQLKQLAQKNHISLFTIMFSLYLVMLSRLSNQKEVICSIIGAGRGHVSLQPIVGFFVNSILFKTHVDDEESFIDLLQRVNAEVMETLQHQDYPLELVFKELKMKYPEVPISFNMLNIRDTTIGLEMNRLESSHNHIISIQDVKFDMEVYITEYENGILLNWTYKKSLYDPMDIQYIVGEYIKLLDFFTGDSKRTIAEYENTKRKKKPLIEISN